MPADRRSRGSFVRRVGSGQTDLFYGLEKKLQLYSGRRPALFYSLYKLARKNPTQAVSLETQVVIEGFPRTANTFAVLAFRQAQRGHMRIAHNLHVPAQVIRASQWQIPTLVLIREPKDAVLSFVVRDPISVDHALEHYISFYEIVANYREDFVLGHFREITGDYGSVIGRINERFGTDFLPFQNTQSNVKKVFDRMERGYKKWNVGKPVETKISRPSSVREEIKRKVKYEIEDPRRQRLISEAEAIYDHLSNP